MHILRLLLASGTALMMSAVPSKALIVGGPDIITPGVTLSPCSSSGTFDSVLKTCHVNENQQGFDEVQDKVLSSALTHDSGVLAAGKTVSSHMIFLSNPSSPTVETATWTFNARIVGVMSDWMGTLVDASNSELGHAGISYGSGFKGRGLELASEGFAFSDDGYVISADGKSLSVTMEVSSPGDWIRVVTAVPEPSSMLLMGTGLLGLVGCAWRKKTTRV